jgi:hypothetical protein
VAHTTHLRAIQLTHSGAHGRHIPLLATARPGYLHVVLPAQASHSVAALLPTPAL